MVTGCQAHACSHAAVIERQYAVASMSDSEAISVGVGPQKGGLKTQVWKTQVRMCSVGKRKYEYIFISRDDNTISIGY